MRGINLDSSHLQGGLWVVRVVIISTNKTLHLPKDGRRSALKRAERRGEHGDELDLAGCEMAYELHGKDLAEECSRRVDTSIREVGLCGTVVLDMAEGVR